ncbi:lipid A deacylase LpxR family protein [Rhizosphaericola mali]|uniref:Lipid A deacylase LpxR family protein n=1 Tax=Rhizosphaericola mali TaxID=2545455 RepID=A0A5P2G9H9_9BACT|nr:lipid A deacylase LpxR family protein [Rhizosphaericola mali]QES90380.1 lipid A deacylase LpxR family protein [Rhizosphaericola mali]
MKDWKKIILCGAILSIGFLNKTQGQKLHNKAIGINSENDSYMLMGKDGYYTNGLTLYYGWASKDVNKTNIRQISFGQYMYNAKNGSYKELNELDRPITAYLFVRYNQTHFVNKNVLRWGVDIGTIGPNALGKPVQQFIHSTLGMYKPQEWPYQLRNALAINSNIEYASLLIAHKNLVFQPVFNANLGMTYTDLSASALLQLGRILENSKSIFWDADLNKTTKDDNESFFFIQPEVKYQIYNATVQGGLFNNQSETFTAPLNRILFQPKMGWFISTKKMGWKFYTQYQSKVAKTQIQNQIFGGVEIKLKF